MASLDGRPLMDPFFEEHGYKIVRDAYPVAQHRAGLADLFAYCKLLPATDGDDQSPGSPAFYNDIEMSKLLIRLMPRISAETGINLYPTYAYMRRYGPDGQLNRHRDRPACEITCTLCIGFDGSYNWPIWIQDRHGREHEVSQKPGDLLIYRGRDQDHWREPADARVICQAQVFLHYVDQDGPHQNEVFDAPKMQKVASALIAAAVNKQQNAP